MDWLDSVSQPGWHYFGPDEDLNFELRDAMQTRGVLVAVDSLSLTVATTIAPRGLNSTRDGYLDVLTIPRGCVVAIKVIP